ncbi:MAG: three-Cys-motif partner protein TcmP [Acidimicrobiales bacterium]
MIWERDPHTGAKHQLLHHYLSAWFPIMTQGRWGSVGCTYVDAFAGPGEYVDGSKGSPIIALSIANWAEVTSTGAPINLVFVEKDTARFEHLEGMLESHRGSNPNITVAQLNDACEDAFVPALDRINAWGRPIFANFDGWGVDTPYALVERVGRDRDKAHEVLITFEAQWFTRFATLSEIDAGDRVFGNQRWRKVATLGSPQEKRSFLVEEYRRRLDEAGFPFSLTFELIDEGGHELLLVYGTSGIRGVEKMKDAMWHVDPVHGSRFRDPKDPNQIAFDLVESDPDLRLLKQQLLLRLESGAASLAELKNYALGETVYRGPHAGTAVAKLVEEGKVTRDPGQTDEQRIVRLASASLF